MTARFLLFGVGQFPERKPFRFGTVVAADRRGAIDALDTKWRETMPFEPPDFEPARGMLLLREGDFPQ